MQWPDSSTITAKDRYWCLSFNHLGPSFHGAFENTYHTQVSVIDFKRNCFSDAINFRKWVAYSFCSCQEYWWITEICLCRSFTICCSVIIFFHCFELDLNHCFKNFYVLGSHNISIWFAFICYMEAPWINLSWKLSKILVQRVNLNLCCEVFVWLVISLNIPRHWLAWLRANVFHIMIAIFDLSLNRIVISWHWLEFVKSPIYDRDLYMLIYSFNGSEWQTAVSF